MVFSSLTFLTLFLPPVLLAAWGLSWAGAGKRWENGWLLAASLFFYFWGGGGGVCWLAANIVFNAACAEAMSRRESERWRKGWLAAAIAGDLGMLGWFKYAGWGARTLNLLPGVALPVPEVALPLGISFYTFQAMSYVVDVYRRDVPPARRWGDFACYVSMFPQLVAGPIVRYADVAEQLRDRSWRLEQVASGMRRFLCGLAKKVLLANTVGAAADAAWGVLDGGGGLPAGLAWGALLCYTLQIYYDFSGYSDMAIGLGRMFGFEFRENFLHPYTATSVRDFWRKWHISLSSWFRDYLYIPLGGNRKGAARTALNGLAVFALCGLWHGASGMFLAWGLWHGLFLMLEKPKKGRAAPSGWRGLAGRVYALAVVGWGWVMFRSENWGVAGRMAASLAGLGAPGREARALWVEVSPELLLALAAGVALAGPVAAWARDAARRRMPAWGASLAEWAWLTALGAASVLELAGGSYNAFLYFRF
jgi:alginate O-acetyltransferase complex protein AlgI